MPCFFFLRFFFLSYLFFYWFNTIALVVMAGAKCQMIRETHCLIVLSTAVFQIEFLNRNTTVRMVIGRIAYYSLTNAIWLISNFGPFLRPFRFQIVNYYCISCAKIRKRRIGNADQLDFLIWLSLRAKTITRTHTHIAYISWQLLFHTHSLSLSHLTSGGVHKTISFVLIDSEVCGCLDRNNNRLTQLQCCCTLHKKHKHT